MNIKLITDSACDLSIDYIRENNIDLASLMVNLNGEFIPDDLGQTLSHKDFYKVVKEGAMPSTTQVNVGTFYEMFTKYVEQEKTIIYIGLSGALSGTVSSAVTARNMVIEEHPNAKIYVIDSLSASVGQGSLVYKAVEMIKNITMELEKGNTYEGKVVRILNFGAFVEVAPGKEGMVHISKLAKERVEKVEDVVKVGDMIKVKVIEIDDQGRINLSMKDLNEPKIYEED